MKPFNLEEAKSGRSICTRNGKPARIICFDRNEKTYPIVALVDKGPFEAVYTYTNEGRYNAEGFSDFDLLIVPTKRTGWINIYPKFDGAVPGWEAGEVFLNKEEAIINSRADRITTTEIEWEE